MYYYKWVGSLCGANGMAGASGMLVDDAYDDAIGIIDAASLNLGRAHGSTTPTSLGCDFDAQATSTNYFLVDGNYARYSYNRIHDFSGPYFSSTWNFTFPDELQESEHYRPTNSEGGSKSAAVFSQVLSQTPTDPISLPFEYTTGYDDSDIAYDNQANFSFSATGMELEQTTIQDNVVTSEDTYMGIGSSNKPSITENYRVPITCHIENNLFLHLQIATQTFTLQLYSMNFADNTFTLEDSIDYGTLWDVASEDWFTGPGLLAYNSATDKVYFGNPQYTGSKPQQGRVAVIDIDTTNKTITHNSYIDNPTPSRYGYFGTCLCIDGGPSGTGQLMIGAMGDEMIRFFDPVTHTELTGHLLEGARDSAVGGALSAYNGVLIYAEYTGSGITVKQSNYIASAWGAGAAAAVNPLSNPNTIVIGLVFGGPFTDPLGSTSTRPGMSIMYNNVSSYYIVFYGPYSTTNYRYNSQLRGILDSNTGRPYGICYESLNMRRFLPESGNSWNDADSYDASVTTNSDLRGAYDHTLLMLTDPLDSSSQVVLNLRIADAGESYNMRADIINIGLQDVQAYIAGDFYAIHTIDIQTWALIDSFTLTAAGGGTGDNLRWMISVDGGNTWQSSMDGTSLFTVTDFASGPAEAGDYTTIVAIVSASVGSAASLKLCFLFEGGTTDRYSSPVVDDFSFDFIPLSDEDPEFVLNYSTHPKVQRIEIRRTSTALYHKVFMKSPHPATYARLLMSAGSTEYTDLYG